jgi:hypothetical protein
VRAGDLSPDDADLGATDRSLGAVDVGNALTGVPLCGVGAVDTLKLEEGGTGVGVALAPLVGDVLSPAHDVSHCPNCLTKACDRSCPAGVLYPGNVTLPISHAAVPTMEGLSPFYDCSPPVCAVFEFDIRIQSRADRVDWESDGRLTSRRLLR